MRFSNTIRTNAWLAATAVLALGLSGCESEPVAAVSQAAVEPPPKLQPGAKTVVLERVGDRPFDKTFDDLRFEMELNERFRREMLTDQIEALAGKPIRIRGYILPTAQQHGIKQFVLVRDNQECCFGPGAALFDCILVEMAAGKTASFSIRPVAVAGTFTVREFIGPGDRHLAIYHLDADSVE